MDRMAYGQVERCAWAGPGAQGGVSRPGSGFEGQGMADGRTHNPQGHAVYVVCRVACHEAMPGVQHRASVGRLKNIL